MKKDRWSAPRRRKWRLLIALAGSDILALFAGGIWTICERNSDYGDVGFYMLLGSVWLLGVAGVVFSEFRWGREVAYRNWFGVGAAAGLGLFLYWFNWWLNGLIGEAIKCAM